MGADIEGPGMNSFLGSAIALSDSGDRLAVGASSYDLNDTIRGTGLVQVYDLRAGEGQVEPGWWQRGPDIYGEASDDAAGGSVALAGNVVALGAPGHERDGENVGMARAYTINDPDTDWAQPHGWEEYGRNASDDFGWAISLSNNSNIMAVGAPSSFDSPGYVRIFELDDKFNQWVGLGNRIEGKNNDDMFGWSVSLSADGHRVAIGGHWYDVGVKYKAGHAQVYEYNVTMDTWLQLGTDMEGREEHAYFGESVSLNANATRVAIGGGGDSYVGVYQYDEFAQSWFIVGDIIESENEDGFGGSVSLSTNGDIVAIGAPFSNDGGVNSGHVRIFELTGSDGNEVESWQQLGTSLSGGENDNFGQSVSISANGKRVAIGAPFYDGKNGQGCGHVQVFELTVI